LRIISGKYKGKNLIIPKGLPVRPTTDYAKESLFNILNNTIDFHDLEILELFAGTGNIGYEFMSRGAKNITSVDLDFKCVQFIKKMNKELGIKGRVIRSESFRFIKSNKDNYNMIYADPPYDLENILLFPDLIFDKNLLQKNGLLIIEHKKEIDFSSCKNYSETRQYGKVNFSFFNFV
jgi:16S rRNA (guanine(966)-N(2))-methyltransferase RsmD